MKRKKAPLERLLKNLVPYQSYKIFRYHYKNLKTTVLTGGSFSIFWAYLISIPKNLSIERRFSHKREDFIGRKSKLETSADWFTVNIPQWYSLFEEYQLFDKKIEVLEIGSWEGLSSYFLLDNLANASLTCVDTWEGADEHKDGAAATLQILSGIESKFERNLSAFKSRVKKFKGRSYSFFNENIGRCVFDLIYVDGSHHSDDLIVDAIKSFEQLKVGGLIIFDDYFWRHYRNPMDNPAGAINAFLRLKRGSYKVIRIYYQIVLLKTSDRY